MRNTYIYIDEYIITDLSQWGLTMTHDILKNITPEVRLTFKQLSNDTRLAIVLLLLKNGEMSFTELCESLSIKRNSLSHHIRKLMRAALVHNFYKKKDDTAEFSYYEATNLSQSFVDGLLSVMEPKKSSSSILADLYIASQEYAESYAALITTLQQYGDTKLDSIMIVQTEKLEMEIPSQIKMR